MTATFNDREWQLEAAWGKHRTEGAAEMVRTWRATRRRTTAWADHDPELTAAVEQGMTDPEWEAATRPEVEPADIDPATVQAWEAEHPPDDVAGELVLDDVAMFLGRFISFPSPEACTAVALWAVHTHMVRVFESTPRLALLSPEPGSGKTRVLEVLELLVPIPHHYLGASAASIFRLIEATRPVLLFDEVDALFRGGKSDESAEALRALINAGHRQGATVPRCVGPKQEVQNFNVYAAVALAGLGDLPDTIMSRSVVIRMRRRAPHERVESFRRRLVVPEANQLKERIARWAKLVRDDCGEAWPEMPPGITDRPADVWEALLAIADAAGGSWPKLAREACVALVKAAGSPDDQSLGVRLLADVRSAFGDLDRLKTADLLDRLHAMDEAPWADLRGKAITAQWLAKKLRPYGATSRDHRFPEGTRKGYLASDFHDAWSRYLTMGNKGNMGNSPASSVAPVADVADGTAA